MASRERHAKVNNLSRLLTGERSDLQWIIEVRHSAWMKSVQCCCEWNASYRTHVIWSRCVIRAWFPAAESPMTSLSVPSDAWSNIWTSCTSSYRGVADRPLHLAECSLTHAYQPGLHAPLSSPRCTHWCCSTGEKVTIRLDSVKYRGYCRKWNTDFHRLYNVCKVKLKWICIARRREQPLMLMVKIIAICCEQQFISSTHQLIFRKKFCNSQHYETTDLG